LEQREGLYIAKGKESIGGASEDENDVRVVAAVIKKGHIGSILLFNVGLNH
jgi:hypothetical protein